ncbi:related to protein MAM3 [Zygosaccharomyces bailii]|nr:related to protein MAM3 [Zygosaccharomyces bailii]
MLRSRHAALPAVLLASVIPRIHSLPLVYRGTSSGGQPTSPHSHQPEYKDRTTYMIISACLVVLGGVFAGLTLGLMGQDEVYLKVISTSGSPKERRLANKVLSLISRGKHWLLVTLLLSNVITNETLPIVLDRCLGGGWQAVASSTVLIVIFGEVIPQSVCVKYGLEIGAFFTPFVQVLMYVMLPVAYPIAVLLDNLLGEDHGTMYKKSGLKTLVTLHRTMGVERLTQDEVTIISAVLDLKEKQVQEIMTPIENVFTMSADRVLDEKTVGEIFDSGFSRIPIYLPNEPTNFIGMLLVRVLISYDPEDALPVSHFPLATLPETAPETSCLNILNYFQEGKSHMCIVSKDLGSATGAIGVLTLEDVIEELIGEEIVDESDVFVDIHQRTIREQPGPLSKRHITSYLHRLYTNSNKRPSSDIQDGESQALLNNSDSAANSVPLSPTASHREGAQHMRLSSPPPGSEHAHLVLPSNPASNPLDVKKPFVTIKRPNPTLAPRNSSLYGTVRKPAKPGTKENSSDSREEEQTPRNSQSLSERERINNHVEVANQAREFTQRTGTPVQVTTNLAPPKDDGNEHASNSTGNHEPENALLSSSYKSTKHGIVESIITVKGVPKTIIEPAQNWDQNPKAGDDLVIEDQPETNAKADSNGNFNLEDPKTSKPKNKQTNGKSRGGGKKKSHRNR